MQSVRRVHQRTVSNRTVSPKPESGNQATTSTSEHERRRASRSRIDRRGPCSYCRAHKKRCVYPFNGATTCSSCVRLGVPCIHPKKRRTLIPGRPRTEVTRNVPSREDTLEEENHGTVVQNYVQLIHDLANELDIRVASEHPSSLSTTDVSVLRSFQSDHNARGLVIRAREIVKETKLSLLDPRTRSSLSNARRRRNRRIREDFYNSFTDATTTVEDGRLSASRDATGQTYTLHASTNDRAGEDPLDTMSEASDDTARPGEGVARSPSPLPSANFIRRPSTAAREAFSSPYYSNPTSGARSGLNGRASTPFNGLYTRAPRSSRLSGLQLGERQPIHAEDGYGSFTDAPTVVEDTDTDASMSEHAFSSVPQSPIGTPVDNPDDVMSDASQVTLRMGDTRQGPPTQSSSASTADTDTQSDHDVDTNVQWYQTSLIRPIRTVLSSFFPASAS